MHLCQVHQVFWTLKWDAMRGKCNTWVWRKGVLVDSPKTQEQKQKEWNERWVATTVDMYGSLGQTLWQLQKQIIYSISVTWKLQMLPSIMLTLTALFTEVVQLFWASFWAQREVSSHEEYIWDCWDCCEQKKNTQQVSSLEQLVSPAVCFFPRLCECVLTF